MPEDAFGGTYSKNTLTSGPHKHNSGINVFQTEDELTDVSKVAKGAMAYVVAEKRIYIYTGAEWMKSGADFVTI